MFTSRSEFRLTLRPDNADLRLTEKGYQIGLVSEMRYRKMLDMKRNIEKAIELLKDFVMSSNKWREKLNLTQFKATAPKT